MLRDTGNELTPRDRFVMSATPFEDRDDNYDSLWSAEIARRIADIAAGRVQTIPAELAEQMICGDVGPNTPPPMPRRFPNA